MMPPGVNRSRTPRDGCGILLLVEANAIVTPTATDAASAGSPPARTPAAGPVVIPDDSPNASPTVIPAATAVDSATPGPVVSKSKARSLTQLPFTEVDGA